MNPLTTSCLLIVTLLLSSAARAGEFRFQCMGEVTGLCDLVWDGNGKENHQGATWEQGIILVGEFSSGVKRTPGGLRMAPSEDYREFRMTGIKLLFPVSRFEVAAGGNDIDGPMIIETHFSFASLFPEGVKVEGKAIDLDKHVAKRVTSQ
jgi:hypothetical protein